MVVVLIRLKSSLKTSALLNMKITLGPVNNIDLNHLPDIRDGRNVPTAMLYGRVVEHVGMSIDEMQKILQRLASH